MQSMANQTYDVKRGEVIYGYILSKQMAKEMASASIVSTSVACVSEWTIGHVVAK